MSFHGRQIHLSHRESIPTSAGGKGLQLICYDPFTEQKEKLMFNMKYSVCAFDANKKQKLLIIALKKKESFPFGLNLEVLCRTALSHDIRALHEVDVKFEYCRCTQELLLLVVYSGQVRSGKK